MNGGPYRPVSQDGQTSALTIYLPSGPALAARGCCRICKVQRLVIDPIELWDCRREYGIAFPKRGKEEVVPEGVEALETKPASVEG